MPNLWYKNAIVYCVDVEKFMDASGDGTGDFAGLADRLDHLERLGVTCIWLNPFFPSPNRDNGYDITDYYGVDPRYGTLGDFVEFMHAARDRGMRVIIDLVVNHTSTDHPWFQAARSDENSPFRDWYVWSKEKPENAHEGMVFPGVQDSIWSYDRTAKAWYLHRFYDHQADLNTANPAVREEILKIMGFWLALGVSGFRLDAVPFLIDTKGMKLEPGSFDPYSLLTEMHDFMAWRRAGAVLLAEANIPYSDAPAYFDGGDRMNMIFDFMLNQHLFLSLARGTAAPLRHTLQNRPRPDGLGQWANFLRNHDELDLGRLSIAEREEAFAALGPDASMQIYERGLRRRLAPMLEGDMSRLKLAYSLLFALPGTPVLWYGEEIGMGENLALPEREAVRTPMQWADEPNAGFSRAATANLIQPILADGDFGYQNVNVAQQVREPGSLLRSITRLVQTRRSTPEIGWGEWELVDVGRDDVLALSYSWRGARVVTVHNFSPEPVSFPLEIDGIDRFEPLLADHDAQSAILRGETLDMAGFGFCWLRCDGPRK
ncbi:maltose alpha-D-glucosyltransferase/ alpha-amylase [Devosia enhydra]|uniref:Maltose alpha-D-glucosyltransferase/ alpha-amylase n=2 Tax=Devosia enhydra TaxID=665118 RepID=A0A1K2HWC4_9HYPH|nr:alpha-amylase family protein [Devosia enhydra]SFZ82935.1 maltose alpha-D-glucosyltransferase/ alpha-amylase [Devosia enhydra]